MSDITKKKILVLGLEKSGKTSIVLNFVGKFSLSDYVSLKNSKTPNIVKLEKDNIKFSIWDFSGKETYRNEFLENSKNYLIDTEEIFFVIDIQEIENYDLALKFVREVLEKLKEYNLKVEFTFFLHKYDHDLFERFPDLKIEKIDNLISRIKQLIPPEEFHEIYKSTIYTLMDKIHIY